jgi:hypothetical protein
MSIKQPPGTGGEQVPGGRGADTTAAGGTLAGFETRLLSELQMVVAERAATAGQQAGPAGQRAGWGTARHPAAARGPADRAWPRRLALTGALSAALTAALAVTLTLTISGGAQPPGRNFAAATTVAAVLDNAALAALREPAVTPRPGQFVYTKTNISTYQARHHGNPAVRGTQSIESWKSVAGTHRGITVNSVNNDAGGTKKVRWVERWCAGGYAHPPMTIKGKPVKQPCTARQFADYQPWLPTTAAGMLAYLEGTLGPSHTDPAKLSHGKFAAQNMLEEGFYLLTAYDLTPAQQAAMYHALAQIPGLTIVPKVTDILGRAGVGIRSHPAPGLTWTAIFDPTTFKPLGSIVETRLVDDRTAVAVPATIVNKVGQRP